MNKQVLKNPIETLAGQYFDSESSLHYNHHRYYDPTAGRYLRADPVLKNSGNKNIPYLLPTLLHTPKELGLYSYSLNNPIVLIDPKGLAVWACYRGSHGFIGDVGGIHGYLYNDRNGNTCGMTGSSHSGNPNQQELGPPRTDFSGGDQCWLVNGSENTENAIMSCCNWRPPNREPWLPFFSDCQTYMKFCIRATGLKPPSGPGRFKPCDNCELLQ